MRQRLARVLCGLLALGVCFAVPDVRRLTLWWAPIPGSAQERYFDHDEPDSYLLFRGGWGSGKTMTLWGKVLKLSAINAPLRGLWLVPDLSHVEDTILPLLDEVDDEAIDPDTGGPRPWFLSRDQWHYHQQKHVFTWVGGGPIQFVTAENAKSIAGTNAAWCAVDEPGSTNEVAWRNTCARVRHVNAKLRQRVAAGTAENLGFLDNLFGPERLPNYHLFEMATTDNVELMRRNPAYVRDMGANLTEAELLNYIRGKSVNTTGSLAYPMFDAEYHWRTNVEDADPAFPLRLAFDFNVNPMVCVVGQNVAGPFGQEAHVTDAVVLPGGSTVDQTCDELLKRYPSWKAGFVVYGDATGKARSVKSLKSNYDIIKDRLKVAGPVTLRVPQANPPVTRRLNSVNRLLRTSTGQTRLWLRKTMPSRQSPLLELVRSLQRTQIKAGTDDIHKPAGETITHAGEALGYWIDYDFPASRPGALVGRV